jgi:RimJ/RimL family protein N-acetyltransferase
MMAGAVASTAAAVRAAWTLQARARTGALVCLRPLDPDDREREISFINSLSEPSRYLRLFTPLKFLSRHLLDQLMDIDYQRRMAFVATTQQGDREQFVGVARYGETDEPATAEIGITVTDEWQRCGIARLLMQQLVAYAHAHSIRRLTGLVLPENHAMIALARRLDFTVSYDPAQHVFVISRELTDADSQSAPRDSDTHGQTRDDLGEFPVRVSFSPV